MARVINAKTEVPQPNPRGLYMGPPAMGRTAPITDQRTVVAAMAEAAHSVYTSTR